MDRHEPLCQHLNVTTRFLNGEALIAHYDAEATYRLNEVGSFLWEQCLAPVSTAGLTAQLAERFGLAREQAEADTEGFVSELLEDGLLVREPAFAPPGYPRARLSTPLWNDLEKVGISQYVPVNTEVEITNRCNLSCQHCYLAPRGRVVLTGDETRGVIDDLEELGCFILTLTGGEIFLRRDTLDIVRYARDRQFAVELLTNGNYISAETAQELARLGISRVQVSIYSADPEVHDRITRTRGSLERTIAGVKALTERGIKVVAACVVMSINLETHRSVEILAEELGAQPSFAYPVSAKVDGSKETHRLRLDHEQLYQFHSLNRQKVCRTFDRRTDEPPCHAGSAVCFINSNGDVYPCVVFPMSCGNIRRAELKHIWHSSPQLGTFRQVRIKDLRVCGECELLPYCRLCPGLSWLEDGDMLGPSSIHCEMARSNYRVLTGQPTGQ